MRRFRGLKLYRLININHRFVFCKRKRFNPYCSRCAINPVSATTTFCREFVKTLKIRNLWWKRYGRITSLFKSLCVCETVYTNSESIGLRNPESLLWKKFYQWKIKWYKEWKNYDPFTPIETRTDTEIKRRVESWLIFVNVLMRLLLIRILRERSHRLKANFKAIQHTPGLLVSLTLWRQGHLLVLKMPLPCEHLPFGARILICDVNIWRRQKMKIMSLPSQCERTLTFKRKDCWLTTNPKMLYRLRVRVLWTIPKSTLP